MNSYSIVFLNKHRGIENDIVKASSMREALEKFYLPFEIYHGTVCPEVLSVSDVTEICNESGNIMSYAELCMTKGVSKYGKNH